MSDEQYKELMAKLNLSNGHMQYMDFIMNFGDPRHSEQFGVTSHLDNHKVNPIRGDERTMTALEVESKLRQKLRENFTVSLSEIRRLVFDLSFIFHETMMFMIIFFFQNVFMILSQ